MLSYKKKINAEAPRSSKVKMANFDLYADLPVLRPIEHDDVMPDMTSRDIMTLRKKPFLARAPSPVGSSGSSGARLSVWSGDGGRPKGMQENPVPNPVLLPGTGLQQRRASRIVELHKVNNDCITFIPQNTAPMAKLRKNFTKKRIMKESVAEGVTTDEVVWHQRKQQKEKEQLNYIRKMSGIKDSHLKSMGRLFDFDDEEKSEENLDRTLEEELSRPTYVPGADQNEPEGILNAIGKVIPRKKIAIVTSVVQKIEKKKKEKKEREILSKIQKALADHSNTDLLEAAGEEGIGNEDFSAPETFIPDSIERTHSRHNDVIIPNEDKADKTADVIVHHVNLSDLPEPGFEPGVSEQDRTLLEKEANIPETRPSNDVMPITSLMTSPATSSAPPPDPVTSSFTPMTSSRQKMAHAKSEGNILSALRKEAIAPPPPSSYNKTRDMISYSELLIANAKRSDRSVSVMDLTGPGDDFADIYKVDIELEPSYDSQVYYLPPEVDEERPRTPSSGRAKRSKSRQSRPKSRNKNPRRRNKRSISVKDLRVINRLESIVDRQSKIIDRMQTSLASGEVPKRHKSMLNVVPVNSDAGDEKSTKKTSRPKSSQNVKELSGSVTSLTISLTSVSSSEEKNRMLTSFNDLESEKKTDSAAPSDGRSKHDEAVIRIPVPAIKPKTYKESDIDEGLGKAQGSGSRAPSRGGAKPRRRKSIIRLKGVKGENDENLAEKVKEILAETTTKAPGENWEISWAKRASPPPLKRSKSFIKRMKGLLGFKSPSSRAASDDVIAEIVHKTRLEAVELNPTSDDVEVKPKPLDDAPEPKPRKSKEENSLSPPRANTLHAQSSIPDGESSDVGPLPEIVTSAKRRRSMFSRSQLSVDSGFSTNPPEEENPELPNQNAGNSR